MDKLITKLKEHLDSVAILLLAGFLRFTNLGYSDYQGDEIKALFLPDAGQSISDFLLTQRKGPVQFVITWLLKFFDLDYSNEFFMRLPFAIAGTLAVYFLYNFLKIHFGRKTAFLASFFVAVNGFFIAFSRIVQYQSFVILFMVLALYMFTLAAKSKVWSIKGIYLGFIFWALSILSHYDGIFIFPFVLYLLGLWVKNQVLGFEALIKFGSIRKLKHLIYAGLIFTALLAVFYIPFIFNIDAGTQSYWQGRLSGTGGKISNSRYLFSVYQPIYVIHIYVILFIFGLMHLIQTTIMPMIFSKAFRGPAQYLMFMFLAKDFFKAVALTFWFLVPFVFLEGIVNIPGTHIYTYLLPAAVFMAFGVLFLEDLAFAIGRYIYDRRNVWEFAVLAGITVVMIFMYLQSVFIFVDHAKEYPWSNKKFLFWVLPRPSATYHLSIFGFPYNRDWDGIADYILNEIPPTPCPVEGNCPEGDMPKITVYSTNERDSISRYYVPYTRDIDQSGYYIFIHDPQSFSAEITQEKARYWLKKYEPVKTFYRQCTGYSKEECLIEQGADVYYLPSGELNDIRLLGY